MRRDRYQQGSLVLKDRRKGKVWKFRWREVQLDGSIRRRSAEVGSYDEYPNESAAQKAADALRLDINQQTQARLLKEVNIETLEEQKAYSTQYAYEVYLKKWILPRWRSYRLIDVKAVDVEKWLKSLRLARGSKAKIRNLMSALVSHAIRWEWTARNPITSVRQSAKRESVPDVLTPEELAALLLKLPEPLRTAAELDAFTGLRRGELIGLQWEDVDFENFTVHVRRSVVMMVQGNTKTEASAKDVPLDAALAESLLKTLQSLQQIAGLGVCFTANERQATVLAGCVVEEIWSACCNESGHFETRWLSHVPSFVYDAAHAEQRRHQSGARTSSPCEQPNHSRSVRAGEHGRETFGAEQAREGGVAKRIGKVLRLDPIGPQSRFADSLEVFEKYGGDDETRTRDLCRDRAAL